MLALGIAVGAAFVLQMICSILQMKHFTNEFLKMRRERRVVCGRKAGGFHAGAIVLFGIDEEGYICESKKLEGVTCIARVKRMQGFEGKHILDLTGEEVSKAHRNLRKAIQDAVISYRAYVAGEEIPMPPPPLKQMGNAISNTLRYRFITK